MGLKSIVTRVYLGFLFLTVVMVGTAWFGITGNQQLTERMETITQQATPLMINSAELNSSILSINRSLTPYFSAMYVDELDPFIEVINQNTELYQQKFDWFRQQAQLNRDIAPLVTEMDKGSIAILQEMQATMDLYVDYLDVKDMALYEQSKYQSVNSQLNSNLVEALSGANSEATAALNGLMSVVGVLNSDANEAFAMQDMSELRSVLRQFNAKKERFDEAVADFKRLSPSEHRSSETALALFSMHLFMDKGAVKQHADAVQLYQDLTASRSNLELMLDEVLLSMDALSDYALNHAEKLHLVSQRQSKQTLMALASVAIGSLIVVLFTGYQVAAMIKKPSRLLRNSLERVANKDLSAKVDYDVQNEFGVVATKVNLVIDHLSTMIEQMRSSAGKLNQASLINQDTSQSLNQAINDQTEQTMIVATAMQQIESSVAEISRSASDTLNVVTSAVGNSSSGQQMMEQNISLLNQLSSRLTESTETIHTLEKESASIESILDVISGISEQTNLLALNAAIEAARAGEHGRGFSVVADEVRVLAARTTESTKEIQQKIDQLQSSSKLAVSQISQCADGMTNCVEQTNAVNHSLESVHDLLNQVEQSSHQIAAATTEHQSVASEVTRNIDQIHQLATQNQTRSQELAALSDELELMAETQSQLTESFILVENELDTELEIDTDISVQDVAKNDEAIDEQQPSAESMEERKSA